MWQKEKGKVLSACIHKLYTNFNRLELNCDFNLSLSIIGILAFSKNINELKKNIFLTEDIIRH